jgi:hypothetical protein
LGHRALARQNQHRNLNRNCIAVGGEFWQLLWCGIFNKDSQVITGYNTNINSRVEMPERLFADPAGVFIAFDCECSHL